MANIEPPRCLPTIAFDQCSRSSPTLPRSLEWLSHANIATTRIYDRRKMKPEDSPTFKHLNHH